MSASGSKIRHRRRRPAVSCSLCRKRKIRCNRESPCSNCVRSRSEVCVYDPSVQHLTHTPSVTSPQLVVPVTQDSRQDPPTSYSAASTSSVRSESSFGGTTGQLNSLTLISQPSPSRDPELEALRNKIRQLEDQLSSNPARRFVEPSGPTEHVNHSIETTTSELAGTFHVQHERRLTDQPHISRSRILHKTRVFGQTHWSNGVIHFRDIFQIMEPLLREHPSQAAAGLRKCKSLGRFIKEQRSPPWPTPLRFDTLPGRDIADKLVENYLQTIETVYRTLHIPTFREEYEAFWNSKYNDTERDRAFLVQLKLVLALGSITYDDSFSLRPSALQWVYEAQTWASEPNLKTQLNTRYIQNEILLLIARELSGVGGDLIWISTGSLVRTAIYMGLHRDPTRLPNRSAFDCEMHRRLWNTILEIALSASMSSGGPILISLDDFDTMAPGNFDDEQLIPTTTGQTTNGDQAHQRPLPKLEGDYTQASVAVALRRTFPTRLAIARFLNDFNSPGTYAETLRLDADLRAAYKVLCRTLQRCREPSDSTTTTTTPPTTSPTTGPAPFASSWVDFQIHRCILALHTPFFTPALHSSTSYAFSRKVVVETSLKIWRAAYPSPSPQPPAAPDLLSRLTICGAGFIRTVTMLASLAVAAELRTQLLEESATCLGVSAPPLLRPDLLTVVHDARAWLMRCHEVGELNVKGSMLVSLVVAQVDGLIRGVVGREEMARCLVEAVEAAVGEVMGMLEERAREYAGGRFGVVGDGDGDGAVGGGGIGMHLDGDELASSLGGGSNTTPPDLMGGWDFMYQMPDTWFGAEGGMVDGGMINVDPAMGWMFTNDGS